MFFQLFKQTYTYTRIYFYEMKILNFKLREKERELRKIYMKNNEKVVRFDIVCLYLLI